ncbi:hypothetical protein ACFL6C_05035 [Myxococcota bacterium]
MDIQYDWIPGNLTSSDLLKECADLYSHHYGHWSAKSPTSPGERIRLAGRRLTDWLRSGDSIIAMARLNGRLLAYAIANQTNMKEKGYGVVSWVTQLVVHEDHRNCGVVYRKEQFFRGGGLPCELLVRDRRYHVDEIQQMCRDAGLRVIWHRFVRAGHWDHALEQDDAKEILLLCSRERESHDAA